VGLKLILFLSTLAIVAPISEKSEPGPGSVIYEVYFEDSSGIVVPTFPNHTCNSLYHDDFFEIASLAAIAGFPGAELHTAVAVAYAESLGDPEAVNRNRNGSKDSGLWQINSVHGYSDLKKPHVNAQAAFKVWSDSGWAAWYAHTPRGAKYGSGGRFLEWLNESQCTIDFYHEVMVYYRSYDERWRGEDVRFDALPALR